MSQRRIMLVASFAVLAFVLALASLAWACAPQGTVALTPDTGRAGASVTATVNGFPADPVELRWGSNTGPVLANGTGPAFSATFTVPSAAAGAYVVVAQTADEHGLHSQGRAVFTIPEPPADPPSPPPPSPSPKPTPGLPLNPVSPLLPSSPASKGKTIQGTSGGDRLVGTPVR